MQFYNPSIGVMQMGLFSGISPIVDPSRPILQQPMVVPPVVVPEKSNEPKVEKPMTTVFVGNITEKASDLMIKQMLQKCGSVVNWKRIQGASGKLQAFGFCEYDDPESTLRCMRLLNGWVLSDRALNVKVDLKTTSLLNEYKKKRQVDKDKVKVETRERKVGEEGEIQSDDDEILDEETKQKDRVAVAAIEALMKEYARDLSAPTRIVNDIRSEPSPGQPKPGKVDDYPVDGEKFDRVVNEIKLFREKFKDEEERMRQVEKERKERVAEELRRRQRQQYEEEKRKREREERERRRKERSRSRSRSKRSSGSKRRRSTSRSSPAQSHSNKDRIETDKSEDAEESHERKKLERKLRERETQYRIRLENWQIRERKRRSHYAMEKEREIMRRKDQEKNAKRLLDFLEDYDDDRFDAKYYKGAALARKLKDRGKEIELDERDRLRERDELDELRRKLIEKGVEDVETELENLQRDEEERIRIKMEELVTSDNEEYRRSISRRGSKESEKSSSNSSEEEQEDMPVSEQMMPDNEERLSAQGNEVQEVENEDHEDETNRATWQPVTENSQAESIPLPCNNNVPSSPVDSHLCSPFLSCPSPLSVSSPAQQGLFPSTTVTINPMRVGQKKKNLTQINEVFRDDEDDNTDGSQNKKQRMSLPENMSVEKRPLIILRTPTNPEEKKKAIKKLIESIPTKRDDLFAYPMDWDMVDKALMERRIQPWVNKKIVEYIGEEEQTLTDFICQKVMKHIGAQEILEDVRMVLDEEAEVFIVKMWRLLVYETEAKRNGLTSK